jgi:hypothetical protein
MAPFARVQDAGATAAFMLRDGGEEILMVLTFVHPFASIMVNV